MAGVIYDVWYRAQANALTNRQPTQMWPKRYRSRAAALRRAAEINANDPDAGTEFAMNAYVHVSGKPHMLGADGQTVITAEVAR